MSDADDHTDAIPTLYRHYTDALERLDPGGPVRFATLATRAPDGGASARMIVLRTFDRNAMSLTIHTQAASRKCAEIAADPVGELVVWDADARLQVRARVALSQRPGTPAEWAALAASERINYAARPAPGAPLDTPDGAPEPDPAAFVVLTARIAALDVLRLGRDRHIRARYLRDDGFSGTWIGP